MNASKSDAHLVAEVIADAVASKPRSGTAPQSGILVADVWFETDDHNPVTWKCSERLVAPAREVGGIDDDKIRRLC